MRPFILATLSVLAVCSAAHAQTQAQLATIEVRADTTESVSVSCADPESVSRTDVQRVLSVADVDMTRAIQKKFVAAVSEACKAGVPQILVKRDDHGNLTWKRME